MDRAVSAPHSPPLTQPAAPGWRDRLRSVRDRLLTSPGFQRWAVTSPLVRHFARRRARQLFDLVSGFVYSQVLLACVRLRLFERLRQGPQDAAALAHAVELPVDSARRLLHAAAALELVERGDDGRYALGVLGASVLAHPGIVAMVEHHPVLYDDLRDPVALLRGPGEGTRMSRYWAYARDGAPSGLEAQSVAEYSALMAASQPLVAGEILDAYPFARHRRLLDVGGGEGAFIGAVARRAPKLELTLFDLPAVVERARARLAREGLGQRVHLRGGSFLTDPLPAGADLVSLVRVVHDHDDNAVRALLERVRAAMDPRGTLLIAEPMAGTGASVPVGEAYFALYLLAMGSGRSRTFDELRTLLHQAGFGAVRWAGSRRPVHVSVVTARCR